MDMEEIKRSMRPIEVAGVEMFSDGIQAHMNEFLKTFINKREPNMNESQAFRSAIAVIISVLMGKLMKIGELTGQTEQIKGLINASKADLELMAAAKVREQLQKQNNQ